VVGLVDAFSRFGGWSGQLTVQDSSNTACLNSIGDPSLSLTLNTTQVSTCDVVGVQVDGGEAPYTFTVVSAPSYGALRDPNVGLVPYQRRHGNLQRDRV
jgi:hypothetical protein